MSGVTEIEVNFAAVMQELSAGPRMLLGERTRRGDQIRARHFGYDQRGPLFGQRVESLEESVMRKFEGLQFQKIEEQLAVIRDRENVNQKLFDSLHQELNSYRDNFVRDSLQKPFIRDLLVLFDDMSAIAGQLEQAAAEDENRSDKVQARDNIGNMLHFLIEILHRLEVTEIEPLDKVDGKMHRVIDYVAAESAEEDGRIVKRLKRGFIWHGKVLRPEEVIAQRFG